MVPGVSIFGDDSWRKGNDLMSGDPSKGFVCEGRLRRRKKIAMPRQAIPPTQPKTMPTILPTLLENVAAWPGFAWVVGRILTLEFVELAMMVTLGTLRRIFLEYAFEATMGKTSIATTHFNDRGAKTPPINGLYHTHKLLTGK